MNTRNTITFSTYITLFRLCGSPIVVPFFIVHYLPYNVFLINLLIAALFLFFGFTDFLDGFFARKYNQKTVIGATLDHVADKFLTFSACIALTAMGKMSYGIAIALIGREFFVMGLRECALEHNFSIHVSSLSKLKTLVHIICIAWIIMNPDHATHASVLNAIEFFLLLFSLIISWASACDYFIKFYVQSKSR